MNKLKLLFIIPLFLFSCAIPCKKDCPLENSFIVITLHDGSGKVVAKIPRGYFSDEKYRKYWKTKKELKELLKKESTI